MFYTGFPDLDVAAVRARLDRQLALWYELRLLDRRGTGSVELAAAGRRFPSSTRWRIIRQGSPSLWKASTDRLFLRNPGVVAASLGIRRLAAAYEGPPAWLRFEGQLLRGTLFLNAIALLRRGRPIAVRTMAKMADVDVRTVRRWQRLTKWKRFPQAADPGIRWNPELVRHRRALEGRMMRVRADGEYWLAVRLPNRLALRRRPLKKRGVLRRANSALPPSCDSRDNGQRQQLYFTGKRLPASPSQYLFTSQSTDPNPVGLWSPGKVP